jgi:CheY-like chemotaxis protein
MMRDSVPSGGMEMAALHGFIKQSGGHIEAESQPQSGTAYRIYLPLVEETVLAFEAPGDLADAPTGTETILLAEDEESIRRLTRLVLASLGYTVLNASDGQQAVTLASQHAGPIDLLVADVVMPRIGGRELAQQMRVRHPHVRILYISGYTGDSLTQQNLAGPGVGFLQKPFAPMALARRVREILDRPGPFPAEMSNDQIPNDQRMSNTQ